MRDDIYALAFLIGDVVMIAGGYWAGWKFIKQYRNYLLGIEWFIIATSGVNFLIWALRFPEDKEAGEASVQYDVAFFLDAFSRSVGITLLLVVGFLAVTHRHKSSKAVDVAIFAVGIGAGLYLGQPKFQDHVDDSGHHILYAGPATIYLVVNLLTLVFLVYLTKRLWDIGATKVAIATLLVSLAGTGIALTYDFFPFPASVDPLQDRALFYALALTVWGLQLFTYLFAYRALHDHNVAAGPAPEADESKTVLA
ncbi:transporter [Nocardioides silvaticus]|uniref:Transporter n=1 Tax=Nocardioides silvaticus TaxID=2201891 RepID=A0A316TI91_9ACTN|nr:transporter [Nocardioides silvaticus]PWN02949.1 transporter [Nocardioides silvaticus]